jgi:hypothetical protein
MKPRYLAGVVLTLTTLYGCAGLQPEEVLLPRTDISLTVKGELQMEYDHNTCQIGYNEEKHEFRLVNDKLSDWVIFRSDATPRDIGQKVNAYLEYTTEADTRTIDGLEYTVEKTSPDGHVWLWNKDKKIGIIIKLL